MNYGTIAAIGALLCFAAGCGSSALPRAKLTDAQSAITAAEAVGAQNNPRAALHLKLANDQLKQAEALIGDDEHEKARLILESARADAEMALLITRSAQERAEAEQALQRVRDLQ